MENADGFYTLKGYALQADGRMSSALEDYLEMVVRLTKEGRRVRIGSLSRLLHVKASSATKMVRQLDRMGYLSAAPYGEIVLTEKGRAAGDYLLYRHGVVHGFLRALNRSADELEQAEKIEHFLNADTVENLQRLTERLLAEERETGGGGEAKK
ncbi:MAG: metal-dependent transcriptional regulator [Clostridia bacterium]|nr:metal-dependent transcriptional regulator [Clostridia bacterium]